MFIKRERNLSGRGFPVGEHMGERRDDIDSEANQKSTNCGINGSEKWEDYGQEPNWYNNR